MPRAELLGEIFVLKQRYGNKKSRKTQNKSVVGQATNTIVERLEDRTMLYGDTTTVEPLPYDLFFNTNNGGISDTNGVGTGFTFVQPNKNTTGTSSPEYSPSLINDNTATGVLNLTTTGNATNGGPWEGDNSLVNGLQTTFNATTGAWTITVQLQGNPTLSYLSTASDQGGIYFGPNDDNYIKLVAAAQPSPNNQVIQFVDEINQTTHTIPSANSYTNIGSFSSINTLDLRMSGDPTSGTVIGFYSINGGAFVPLGQQFNYTGANESMFFSPTARAGIIAMAKNNLTPIQVGFDSFGIDPGTSASDRPSISALTVSQDSTGAAYTDTSIIGSVILPTSNAGVNPATLTSSSVQLINLTTNKPVSCELNTDGAGGVLIIHPNQILSPSTQYEVMVTPEVLDTNGNSFNLYHGFFTTGLLPQNPPSNSIAFQDQALANVPAHEYTDVKFGPDGDLYASTLEGLIYRWAVNSDGTLQSPTVITTMQTNNGPAGTPREVTGFAFDPASTKTNVMMWVSNSAYGSYGAADFTGKITKLYSTTQSPAPLSVYQDYVVGIPRSIKDHQVEQPTFGPDGNLYVALGSNTAMGAPDNAWGNRPEDLLSAAILEVNVASIAATRINIAKPLGALNVQTLNLPAGQTPYNPYAAGAQVTLYATGVRNAYDIFFVGSQLYAATNGSAANGNVPSTPPTGYSGQAVTGFTNPAIEPDMLYKIVKGGYYGHPDPARGEYILDGGNPNGGSATTYTLANGNTAVVISGYPVGTKADPNYQGTIDVLGLDNSADGNIIYNGNAFSGQINGDIIMAQYSAPQDLSILKLAANGNSVTQTITGVSGLEDLNSPLSVAQYDNGTGSGSASGDLYVSEYGAQTIELLVPVAPGAKISANQSTLDFTEPRGSSSTVQALSTQTIKVTNAGTSLLTFPSGAQLSGTYAADFKITSTLPANLAVGASTNVTVEYIPASGSGTTNGIQTAALTIASNDPNTPTLTVSLRGLPTSGYGGAAEPSAQYIFNLYNIPDGTGTPNAASNFMPYPPLAATDQEVQIKQFQKAGPGPVTLQPLAVYTVTNGVRIGYYNSGDPTSKSQLLELDTNGLSSAAALAATQSVTPNFTGSFSFDPGSGEFGMYAEFPGFPNVDKATDRDSYQEDRLNTWDSTVADQQKMRIYPLEYTVNGVTTTVANSYIFIPEDYTTADDNDAVFIINNVKPGPAAAVSGGQTGGPSFGFINYDEDPNSDVLTFSKQGEEQLQTIIPPATGLKEIQTPHSTIPLEIFNSGSQPMTVNAITINAPNTGPVVNGSHTSAFSISNYPTLPLTIQPGATYTLNVQFVAVGYLSGGAFTNSVRGESSGTLLVTTNDANHPSKTFTLNGFWQTAPETTEAGQYDEFPIQTTLQGLGYTTNVGTAGQLLNGGGSNTPIGDEIISPFWNVADPGQDVTLHQLQSYHTAGNTATIGWYLQGSTTNHNILTGIGSDSQTVYPRDTGSGNPPSDGTFTPSSLTTPFGLEVDGWYTDNSRNDTSLSVSQPPKDVGHFVRIYPAINENGVYIPNTYILIMDYEGENLDYNDNAYLISNIRPATGLAAPIDVAGSTDTNLGNTLTWNAVSTVSGEATLTGYNVYRSTSQNSGFGAPLNSSPITATTYTDGTAVVGTQYYYRVTAIGSGTPAESYSTEISLTRPGSNVAPATPIAFATPSAPDTITVSWNLSSGATSYTILQSLSGPTGTYSTLATVGGTVTQYPNTGLTTNASYSYEVIANNGALSLAPSSPATATALVAPAAPSGLNLQVNSSTQITVSWNSVEGASSYTIDRSDGNNTNYLPVGNAPTGTTTSIIDSPLLPDTIYYYEIVANNAVGSSSPSSPMNATTQVSIPAAPVADSAVANGANAITITWEPVTQASAYIIERSPDGTDSWQQVGPVGGVTTTSYQDTGLSPSTQYFYQIFSTNSAGNSTTGSNVVNTTTTVVAPAIPAQPTVAAQSGTSISVNWTSDTGAATYSVLRSPDGLANDYTSVYTTLDNATFSYLDPNLSPNTTYYYEIVATNPGGASLPSVSASTATPQVQAYTPGTLTAMLSGLSSIGLSWGISANASGYTIQRSPDNGLNNDWQTVGTTTGASATTFNDINLSQNTTYYYQVIANNSVANSLPSNTASVTTVPAAPASLVVTPASFVGINLGWADTAGETGFSIERSANSTSGWAVVGTVGQGMLTFQDTSLTPATKYFYRVRATSNAGFSDYSSVMSNTTLGTSLLQDVGGGAFTDSLGNQWVADNAAEWSAGTVVSTGAVAIANTVDDYLYYTRRYAGNPTMTFTYPANNGNYTLKLYFAETVTTAAGQRVFNVSAQGAPILTNFDIFKAVGTKTADIQTFNISITTGQLNLLFTSVVNSAIVSAIQLIPLQPNQPATPTGLSATAVDSKDINLSWTNNAINDTSYTVERSLDQVTWTTVSSAVPGSTVSGAILTYADSGLKPNTHYFYRVCANNNGLTSVFSNISSATTIVAAPTGVTAIGNGPTGINVSWTTVTGASAYTVQRSLDGLTNWTTVGSPTSNSFPDSGLTNGVTYFYRVSATVAAGTTSYSSTASSSTGSAATIPTTPANQTAVANSATQILVSWSGVTGATSYQVYRNQDDLSDWSLQKTVTDTALPSYSYLDNMVSPSTQYYYEVIATNSAGSSPAPATAPTAATPALPTAPSGFTITNVTSSEIDLGWNAVTGATGYLLQRSPSGLANTWTSLNGTMTLVGSTETYQDIGLSSTTTYYYQVSVTTAAGTSLPTTPAVSATTLPTAPTGLTITAFVYSEIDLSWNAVSGATNYTLQSSPTGLAGSWSTVNTITPSGNATETYADTSVSASSPYFYQVITNVSGVASAPSASVNTTTPARPLPPTLAISAVFSNEIDLTWNVVSGALSYRLRRSPTNQPNTWTSIFITPSGTTTQTYQDTTVSPSNTYYYMLSVTTANGTSANSITVNTTTPAAPLAPTGLAFSNVAYNEIDLTWNAVTPSISYLLQRSSTGLANSWSAGVTISPSGNPTESYKDNSVLPGTAYYYQISVTTSAGTSAPSASINTTTPAAPLAAPGSFTISNVQPNQVTLNWTESSTVTGFTIEQSTDDATWGTPITVGNVTTTNITGLTPSQTYYFEISANNGAASSAFTTAGPISTPSAAVATTVIVDDTAATVVGTWTSGNTTSGFYGTDYLSDGNTGKGTKSVTFTPNLTAAGDYQVYGRWTAASSRATNVPFAVKSALGTSTVIENEQLNGGKFVLLGTYQFNAGTGGSVTISNTGTNGYVIADAVEFVPVAPVVPAAPTSFTVSNVQSTSLTLTWAESSSVVTGFTIQQSNDDATWGTPIALGNVTTTNITNLTAGQTYYFRISANNGTVSSPFTIAGPTATPSGMIATTVIVDDTAATLVGTWTSGNTTPGFYGTDYLSDGNTGKGTKTATFTPNLPTSGTYNVYARWTAAASRANNVPITVNSAGGSQTVTVNQQQNGGVWVLIGTYTFNAGTGGSVVISNTGTNGYVIADAVEFVLQ
jgi:fibronectin type 3 domain-containing protein